MVVNVTQFDERGGRLELTIQGSQAACGRPDQSETIGVTWTFTQPILRLRPGAIVLADLEVRLLRGNELCRHPEAHTEITFHWSDGNVSPPFMPSNQVWQRFSAPAPEKKNC